MAQTYHARNSGLAISCDNDASRCLAPSPRVQDVFRRGEEGGEGGGRRGYLRVI